MCSADVSGDNSINKHNPARNKLLRNRLNSTESRPKTKKDKKKKWQYLSHQKDQSPVLPATKPNECFLLHKQKLFYAIVWLDSVQNFYLSMVQMS